MTTSSVYSSLIGEGGTLPQAPRAGGREVPSPAAAPAAPAGLELRHEPRRWGWIREMARGGELSVAEVETLYRRWVELPTYLVFDSVVTVPRPRRGLRQVARMVTASLAAKRGNAVYAHRVRRRWAGVLDTVAGERYISRRARSGNTPALFITLTYRRRPGETIWDRWAKVGVDLNRWLSAVSARYGRERCPQVGRRRHQVADCPRCVNHRLRHARVWEAHRDGEPHVHVLLTRPRGTWRVRRHVGKGGRVTWRLASYQEKEDLAALWGHGHVDVQGVDDPRGGVEYLSKYMMDSLRGVAQGEGPATLTMAMLWAMRRQMYGLSGDLVACLTADLIPKSIIQTALTHGDPVGGRETVYLGVLVLRHAGAEPPPWYVDLSRVGLAREARVLLGA